MFVCILITLHISYTLTDVAERLLTKLQVLLLECNIWTPIPAFSVDVCVTSTQHEATTQEHVMYKRRLRKMTAAEV